MFKRKPTYSVALNSFYKQLQKDHSVTQVTVTNHSAIQREVCLWGGHACTPLTSPLEERSNILSTIALERQPQQLLFNPANSLFYALHPFDNSISVVQTTGTFVINIPLDQPVRPSRPAAVPITINLNQPPRFVVPFLGQLSPCTLAVNTKATSPNYGVIAVACLVSNSTVFLNQSHAVVYRHVVVGRPTDVVYDPVEDSFYIVDGLLGTVTKIDTDYQTSPFTALRSAIRLGIDTSNGDLYIHTSLGTVAVYTRAAELRTQLADTLISTVAFKYHPEDAHMYLALPNTNTIRVLNPNTLETVAEIEIEAPATLNYNPYDRSMYVTHGDGQRVSQINQSFEVTTVLALSNIGLYLAINPNSNTILVNHSRANRLTLWTQEMRPTVTASSWYEACREDFKYNPALLTHLKIVASGTARLRSLRLIERSVNGKEICETLSLTNYLSPQNFCNVLEVFAIEGHLLDGHVLWCFTIHPKQVVTFVLYHKQLDMYHFLPEQAKRSLGVQMSKGIPAEWQTLKIKN